MAPCLNRHSRMPESTEIHTAFKSRRKRGLPRSFREQRVTHHNLINGDFVYQIRLVGPLRPLFPCRFLVTLLRFFRITADVSLSRHYRPLRIARKPSDVGIPVHRLKNAHGPNNAKKKDQSRSNDAVVSGRKRPVTRSMCTRGLDWLLDKDLDISMHTLHTLTLHDVCNDGRWHLTMSR